MQFENKDLIELLASYGVIGASGYFRAKGRLVLPVIFASTSVAVSAKAIKRASERETSLDAPAGMSLRVHNKDGSETYFTIPGSEAW